MWKATRIWFQDSNSRPFGHTVISHAHHSSTFISGLLCILTLQQYYIWCLRPGIWTHDLFDRKSSTQTINKLLVCIFTNIPSILNSSHLSSSTGSGPRASTPTMRPFPTWHHSGIFLAELCSPELFTSTIRLSSGPRKICRQLKT